MFSTVPITLLFALAPPLLSDRPPGDPRPISGLRAEVSELAPDGRQLAIACGRNGVVVVDVRSEMVVAEFDCERGEPLSVAWRPDGAEIAVLDHYGFVRVFAVGRAEPRIRCATSSRRDSAKGGLHVVAWARGGDVLVTALGTPAETFDARDGSRLGRIAPTEGELISALAVDSGRGRIALGDETGRVAVFEIGSPQPILGPIRVPRGRGWAGVQALAFHPDRPVLAIGGGDCIVRAWHLDTNEAPRELPHCDNTMFDLESIRHLTFSADGRMLAATSGDGWATRVWDAATWKRSWTHGDGCGNAMRMRASFTPDSRFLVTEFDGVVTRTSDWSRAHRLEPVTDLGLRLVYRAGGDLVWATADDRFLVWSAVSGKLLFDRRAR